MGVGAVWETLYGMIKGYFLATIINQSLPFLLLPVLTRYLSPSEYGLVSLFCFYHILLTVFVGSPVATMVAKYYYENDTKQTSVLIGNGILLSLGLCLCVELLLFAVIGLFGLSMPFSTGWIIAIPIAAVAYNIFMLGLTICRLRNHVFHFSIHQIANTAVNTVLSLIFVCLLYWGWDGRALGFTISYLFSALLFIYYLSRDGLLNWKFDWNLQKRILRFITPLIPNTLQMIIISQVGVFFMQIYYSEELVGLYSLGFQIAFCVKLGVDTLMMSWEPYLYQQLSMNEKMDKVSVTRLLLGLVFLLILGCIATILLTNPVLRIMSTPPFYKASEFVPIFVAGLFFYGIHRFVAPIIIKCDQKVFFAKVSFLSMAILILLSVVLPKYFGYIGIAYAYVISYVILCTFLLVKAHMLIKFPLLKVITRWN